jgi:hypothetical protein
LTIDWDLLVELPDFRLKQDPVDVGVVEKLLLVKQYSIFIHFRPAHGGPK